ncbi:MAG: M1 family aminopeptidase [Pseudomonadota bacterium]
MTISPDGESATGEQMIQFQAVTGGDQLRFETGTFQIIEATLDGMALLSEMSDETALILNLPRAIDPDGTYDLHIRYQLTLSGRGFVRQAGLTASNYFACDWMVCNQSDFADRFTMALCLDAPAQLQTIGPGELTASTLRPDDKRLSRWETDAPYPAYIHAFALGEFERADVSGECETALEIVAPTIAPDVRTAFSPTCEMLRFFERKAGMPFPKPGYIQIYIPESRAAQEAISHSLIGGHFLDPILDDPTEDWLVAHELAHQWWGNGVTAKDLSEFWLNEGIVTFMVAAWKEHRWGRPAYDHEIGLARRRWQSRLADSRDVPLAFDGPYVSLGVRRSIQYSKGAVFLDTLRTRMGEDAFWAGLAQFTTDGYGKSVISEDFERAMQAQTDQPLGPLFRQWVYGDDHLQEADPMQRP